MSAGGWPIRRWAPVGAFVYGVAVATFFAFVFYRQQGVVENIVDLNRFARIALHLAHGDGFTIGPGPLKRMVHGAGFAIGAEPTVRRAPLYPFFGAGLLLLFGHREPGTSEVSTYWPIVVGNCLLFGFTCVFVLRVAARLYGERVGVLAVAMCPLVPQCLRYVGMTEVETMMGMWTVMLADTGVSLASRPSRRTGALFGVVAAAATLTKPVAEVYIVGFLAVAAWQWAKQRTPRKAAIEGALTAVACFALLLAPWTARNWILTEGHFKGLSSNAAGEFLRGYINAQPKYYLLRQDFGGTGPGEKWDPEANAYEAQLFREYQFDPDAPYRADGSPAGEGEPNVTAYGEIAKDRLEAQEVRRRVTQDPLEFVGKAVVQVFTFWYVVETRARSVLVGIIAVVMLGLAALGVLRARRPGELAWPGLLLVAYFNAIYAVFLGFARYSMPLFPTLTALAAGGVGVVLGKVVPRLRSVLTAEPEASTEVVLTQAGIL